MKLMLFLAACLLICACDCSQRHYPNKVEVPPKVEGIERVFKACRETCSNGVSQVTLSETASCNCYDNTGKKKVSDYTIPIYPDKYGNN